MMSGMIVLARHGETAVNRSGRLQGRVDAPLTDRGARQAEALAAAIAPQAPVAVVASPLARARVTAEAIGAACGVEVEVDDRLVELDYGDWDERPVGDVSADEWARWQSDPAFAPPGGESLVDVGRRVTAWCEEQLRREGTVVAVSHVSPIKAAVAWALGTSDEVSWRLHLEVAAICRIRVRGGRPTVVSFNDTCHLRGLDAGPTGPAGGATPRGAIRGRMGR